MKYALLIAVEENDLHPDQPGADERMAAYMAFTQRIAASGVLKGGERLAQPGSATTVRVRDGKRLLTDGPFAETREQLAGFFLVDCNDLDEAIALAAEIPGAAVGSVEVRPVVEM